MAAFSSKKHEPVFCKSEGGLARICLGSSPRSSGTLSVSFGIASRAAANKGRPARADELRLSSRERWAARFLNEAVPPCGGPVRAAFRPWQGVATRRGRYL